MNSLPRIRAGLLRHSLDGQVLVYDSRDDRVHLLDPTTACVLELLEEGGWTPDGIRAELVQRLDVTPDAGFLALALDQLRVADLLDQSAPQPEPMVDVTRRDMIGRLAMTGAAALLVPAIATLTATPGYAQGTLFGVGGPCTTAANCLPNYFCCSGQCQTTACAPPTVVACGACTSSSQCLGNLVCTNGACGNTGNGAINGQACNGNGNCCSGNCVKSGGGPGVCRPA